MNWNMANAVNSRDEYCGPLSLTRVLGIPCREKIDLRADMIFDEVVDVNLITSGYREK